MADHRFRRALRLGAALALAGGAGARAAEGPALFAQHCEVCHQEGGAGTPGLAPPLASPGVAAAPAAYVPLVLLSGLSGPLGPGAETFPGAMPVFDALSDADIARLANLVRRGFNGAGGVEVTADDVAKLRATAPEEPGVLVAVRTGRAP
ncbi:c-type cytochrome [Xanthobacter sediminis]